MCVCSKELNITGLLRQQEMLLAVSSVSHKGLLAVVVVSHTEASYRIYITIIYNILTKK